MSAVLSGTGADVSRLLHRSQLQRKVAVTFADDEEGAAAERVIHQLVDFFPQLIQGRRKKSSRRSSMSF
jgi:hypothetical protein